MKRRTKRSLALVGGAAVLTLAWPGPSSADTTLGGYSGVAMAEAIRIQIYEPTIPIPSTPQVDGGIGYAKANTDTGPVSRATASYLWPGDVLGDGFGALAGNDKAQYTIQVNSRYPATSGAPAENTAQLTKGNGMTTSSDGFNTKATVTGLGVAGPDTDLLSGIGKGIRDLPGFPKPSTTPKPIPDVPLPISKTLAGLATVENVKSVSTVVVGKKTVTSTAQTSMSSIALLAGVITLDDVKVVVSTVSDGKKATTSGTIHAGNIKIAGQDLGVAGDGVHVGSGSATKLPDFPGALTDLLEQVGIRFEYAPTVRTVEGASGALAATGMIISIDTQPLRTALNLGGIVGPLRDLIQKIPKIGSQVGPLLGLGPKIVFRIGDVTTTANAAPAYTGEPIPVPSGSSSTPGGSTGGGGNGGGGTTGTGGGGLPGGGALPTTVPGDTGGGVVNNPPAQPASFALPGLGTIPRMMILGALALAVLGGWVFRALGGFILGGSRSCVHGLATGVPDLRKG